MNGKLVAATIGVATIAIVSLIVTMYPTTKATAEGPKLVGHMQNFVLADKLIPGPDVSWSDADGNKVRLADFEGKVVLFNFWASWCAPCQRELPGIDRIQAKMAGDNFTVVALNIDQGGKGIAIRNAKRLKLKHLKLNLDPKHQVVRKIGLRAMPTTFLFDRKGYIIGALESGAEWDTPEAIELIKYFIDHPDYAGKLKSTHG